MLGAVGGTPYTVCNLAQFCLFFRHPTRNFWAYFKVPTRRPF